jgi:predicted Fe-Mo cluster-binding NifX family protein
MHSHRGLLDGLQDCQMMVARGMGPRLVQDLQQHGIEVFFSMENDVQKAAEAFAKGALRANPRGSCCSHGHS